MASWSTSPAEGRVVLNRLGGQVGDDRVGVEGGPAFDPGSRVIVLLRDCGPERAQALESEGFRYVLIGRYVIEGDTAVYLGAAESLHEVLAMIEENHAEPPKAETPCQRTGADDPQQTWSRPCEQGSRHERGQG